MLSPPSIVVDAQVLEFLTRYPPGPGHTYPGPLLQRSADRLRRLVKVEELLVEATKAIVLHCDDDPEECLSCNDLIDEVAAVVGMDRLMDAVMAHREVTG